MIGLQRGGQALEPGLGQLRVAKAPGFLQDGLHTLLHPVGQVPQNVAFFVQLAALDDAQIPEDLPDGRAQGLGPIDDEQPSPLWVDTPLDEVS